MLCAIPIPIKPSLTSRGSSSMARTRHSPLGAVRFPGRYSLSLVYPVKGKGVRSVSSILVHGVITGKLGFGLQALNSENRHKFTAQQFARQATKLDNGIQIMATTTGLLEKFPGAYSGTGEAWERAAHEGGELRGRRGRRDLKSQDSAARRKAERKLVWCPAPEQQPGL